MRCRLFGHRHERVASASINPPLHTGRFPSEIVAAIEYEQCRWCSDRQVTTRFAFESGSPEARWIRQGILPGDAE